MKKKICLLLFILLLTTGCSCQYNLKIDGNVYKEAIYITGSNSEEIDNLNQKWQIPINKENYYIGDKDTNYSSFDSVYDYKLNNNTLKFSHDFNRDEFTNSTAVSICYKTITITNYEGNIIISTSNIAECFNSYPSLSNLLINITVDKSVSNNNADSVNGNTYTWKLNRDNYKNKSVNLIYENKKDNKESTPDNTKNNTKSNKVDYTMFIFAGILLIIVLIVYAFISILKNKNDEMDD